MGNRGGSRPTVTAYNLLVGSVGQLATHLPWYSYCPCGQKQPGAQRREKQPLNSKMGQVSRHTGPHSLYSIPVGQTGVVTTAEVGPAVITLGQSIGGIQPPLCSTVLGGQTQPMKHCLVQAMGRP